MAGVRRKTAMYTGEKDPKTGKPKREIKLPPKLNDFIVYNYRQAMAENSESESSHETEVLETEREQVTADLNHYFRKSASMVNTGASSSALQRIDTRLGKSLQELKSVTERLKDADRARPFKKDMKLFGDLKRQVEDHQDLLADEIERRSRQSHSERSSIATSDGRSATIKSIASSQRSHSARLEIPKKMKSPTHSVATENESDSDSVASSNASKASSAQEKAKSKAIKAEVASLRVKQEKDLYLEELKLEEEKQKLRLQKEANAAERARLAAELWASHEGHALKKPIRSKSPETRKTSLEKVHGKKTGKLALPSFKPKGESYVQDQTSGFDTPRNPVHHSTPLPRQEANIRTFFQGLAKPKLQTFGGERGHYRQWREQFDIFVHEEDVPAKFKMTMLKKSLTGIPEGLVKNLGFTQAQYEMALEKLEVWYGGDKRALRQCTDDIVSAPPIKEDNLKELADFANKLFDTVAKLKDSGRGSELKGTSTIYTMVLQKIPDKLLFQYQDEMSEVEDEGLETFTTWLNRQAAIRMEMSELKESASKKPAEKSNRTSKFKESGQFRSRSHATGTNKKDKKMPLKREQQSQETGSVASTQDSSSIQACPLCDEKHPVTKCKIWTKAKVTERWDIAKEKGLCFRCLDLGHRGPNCQKTESCGINDCSKTHHHTLHNTPKNQAGEGHSSKPAKGGSFFGLDANGKVHPSKVALRVLPVKIMDNTGQNRRIYAFLDDGSDSSYLRTDVAESLGLTVEKNELTLSTLVNKATKLDSGLVGVTISSLDGNVQAKIGVRTLGEMCDGLVAPNWHSLRDQWDHLRGIEFPKVAGRKKVDLLIGSDHPELTLSLEERIGKPGEPVARRTPLGWTCVGALMPQEGSGIANYIRTCHTQTLDTYFDEELRRMLEMDTVTERIENVTPDEKRALEKTSASITFDGERYTVGIPWKEKTPDLPDNRQMAEKRLRTLEASLLKKPEVAESYRKAIQKNIDQGYIEKVDLGKELEPGWFLPHFAVIKEDRSTTKVRVVYDGAAVHQGKSLNEEMYAGPKLQLEIVDILVKFRQGLIAIAGDIREMFSQIVIPAEDAKYHRILWRDMDIEKPVEVYEAVRLPFGDRASPFLAQFVIKTHAERNSMEYPLAAKSCLNNIYVDDSINSVDTTDEAIDLRTQLTELLDKGGFTIRKWCTNSPEVMKHIPEEDRVGGGLTN